MSVEMIDELVPFQQAPDVEKSEELNEVEGKTAKASIGFGGYLALLFGQTPTELPKEVKILSKKPSGLISSVNTASIRFAMDSIPKELQEQNTLIFVFLVIKMMHDGESEYSAAVGKAQQEFKLGREKRRTRNLMDQSADTIKKVSEFGGMVAMLAPVIIGSDIFRNNALTPAFAFFGRPASQAGTLQKVLEGMFGKDGFQKVNATIQTVSAQNQGLTQMYQTEQQLTMQKVSKAAERSSGAGQDVQRAGDLARRFSEAIKQIEGAVSQPVG